MTLTPKDFHEAFFIGKRGRGRIQTSMLLVTPQREGRREFHPLGHNFYTIFQLAVMLVFE